jgi:16S rRNA processing protein RimM
MISRRRQAADRRRRKRQGAGSPVVGEPAFLVVGKLLRPHGIRGEILMAVLTDFPERIQPGVTFYLGEGYTPAILAGVRHHNKGLLLRIEGIDTREEIAEFRNRDVFVSAQDRPPLPKGEYYLHELIGMQVVTDEGEALGVLSEMIETGATNVYVIRREGKADVLIPATDEVILAIDVKNKTMRVHLLEGLLPD